MTQYQSSYDPIMVPQSNGLAVAGFVCSLVGILVTGGLLCPIGLILSLVALGRPTGKGFAIWGIVIGLLGTCGWLLAWVVAAGAILAIIGVGIVAIALAEPQKLEVTFDMAQIAHSVEEYSQKNNALPASLDVLGLEESLTIDPWQHPYRLAIVTEEPGFDILSDGADGIAGTKDDISLLHLDKLWQDVGQKFKFEVSGDDKGGRVTVRAGDKTIELSGDDAGGKVRVESDGEVIDITGDESGGNVETQPAQLQPSP